MKTNTFWEKIRVKITAAYIAKTALLTAISFIFYMFLKFKLPSIFPSFLEMQFSELPAILAGFSMGPVSGVIVIVLKCCLKMPFTGTAFVGEITDMVLGITYVLPAAIIYCINKNKKNACIGLLAGTLFSTITAILINRYVSVPFYVRLFFNGNFSAIVNMCAGLYKNVNESNFYVYYLFVAVLPFNLLRLGLVSVVTFLVYKKISKILHWEFKSGKQTSEKISVEKSIVDNSLTIDKQEKGIQNDDVSENIQNNDSK